MQPPIPHDRIIHLDFISSLRGLAAFWVVALHLRWASSPQLDAPPWLDPWLGFGQTGVTLFYVVSAFTLCLSMESRRGERMPIIGFFLRRFFRIAPLMYAWLAYVLVRDYVQNGAVYPAEMIVSNVLFLFNLIRGHESGIAPPSWSVGVEMLFYLVFPLIYATSRTWKALAIWLVATLIIGHSWRVAMWSIPGMAWPYPYTGILNQMPVFIIGMGAYPLYKRLRDNAQSKRIGSALSLASLAGMVVMAYWFGDSQPGDSLYARAGLCAALIIGLGLAPWTFVVNRLTVYSGEISYSIYLGHPVCVTAMGLIAPFIYSHLTVGAAYLASLVIVATMVVVLSTITYRIIERPGIRFGSFVIRRITNRSQQELARE